MKKRIRGIILVIVCLSLNMIIVWGCNGAERFSIDSISSDRDIKEAMCSYYEQIIENNFAKVENIELIDATVYYDAETESYVGKLNMKTQNIMTEEEISYYQSIIEKIGVKVTLIF